MTAAQATEPPRTLRECDGCGSMVRIGPLARGEEARCPRCETVLRRHAAASLEVPFALCIAGLVLYAVTMTMPFLGLQLLGQLRSSHVETGAFAFLQDGYGLLSVLVLLTLVAVPLMRLLLLLTVLGGLRLREAPRWLYKPFRWHERLAQWAMLEVFLFGVLVSYTRLADLAQVEIGPAAYGLAALALAQVALNARLDADRVWEALEARGAVSAPERRPEEKAGLIGCDCCRVVVPARPGEACLRCDAPLHVRKPNSVARSWALIVAAVVLYVPANAFPVMEIVTFGRGGPHTILGGAWEFVESGFWPLALVVFLASVAVPLLKLIGLAIMLLGIHRRSDHGLIGKTRLYRVVEAIGRWSMIDIFVVSVLIALVRFGSVASISAGLGAACFAGVVVLTILAAEAFDPRLMWDAAEERRP
ncbi:PqiA/YebS family transporter subunit [Belnapia sp. T18]|uniref:PqiA/YebS family transporter subunit n=1 Tax=Belnapia arida TaxID=2804533 RepID=A0ABS1U702_9PROT|nr:PqiA/YebS family transporter subunit [Belnapia arida]MBL6079719.1 PqiA/YebS family transporter subunit [Belnapia arida]